MNSTGNHVPIFINGDSDKFPSIGLSLPSDSGSDAAIQEGVFFGNIMAANPPQAWYVRGKGFKASIPGRLGASSSNPYKVFTGYRVDSDPKLYSGEAAGLCYQKLMSDGIHADYRSCQSSPAPNTPSNISWGNVLTTYVNANYNSVVTQDNVLRTFDFNGESIPAGEGQEITKAASTDQLWTTSYNFEFSNTVSMYTSGMIKIRRLNNDNAMCMGGSNENIVITKNTGESFSMVGFDSVKIWAGGDVNYKVIGFKKGSSTALVQTGTVSSAANARFPISFAGWDNMLKVEITVDGCIDNVKVKS